MAWHVSWGRLWVVGLDGTGARDNFEAIVEVAPVGWQVGDWQIAATPRP